MKYRIDVGILLWLGLLLFGQTELRSRGSKAEAPPEKPQASAIEQGLFEALNRERAGWSLPPLCLSPALSGLARKHSADMAAHGRLSHESSSGQSYTDRLVAGGFYFTSGGENVARSETFVAEFIHQSLMSSPEHRDNILTDAFIEVGIGVVANPESGAYFITQDFLKSSALLTREEAKDRILRKIRELRDRQNLQPFRTGEEFDKAAQSLAQLRAQGDKNPAIPASLGPTRVYFYISPDLDEMDGFSAEVSLGASEEGGIGVEFSRTVEYPGGAYFVALVHFPRNRFSALDAQDWQKVVRKALNAHRKKEMLRELEWANDLALEAEKWAVLYAARARPTVSPSPAHKERVIFSYWTVDVEDVPGTVKARVSDPAYTRVGLRVIFSRTKEFPRGAFLVSGVVE
jgi:hypothetical protein